MNPALAFPFLVLLIPVSVGLVHLVHRALCEVVQ